MLSRNIAHRGRYPAIDVLSSLSRLQSHLADQQQLQSATVVRNLISVYRDNEDLISIGAYQRGSSPEIDRAIAMQPEIEQFLSQHARDIAPWENSLAALNQLGAPQVGSQKKI